ncbi:MAG: Crp/Fnr family transcriptional regulator [Hyphomicrobiaceae bacterium]
MKVIEYASWEPQVCAAPTADNSVRAPKQESQFQGALRRHVPKGTMLFRSGEPRQLYVVETGALCHYSPSTLGQYDIIEFAFPGDIIGLGSLGKHVSTAAAIADTYVRAISEAELEDALANDDQLFFRLAEAKEREFKYLKDTSLNADLPSPIQRVANYLAAVSGINSSEGRDPLVVSEDMSSGYVAKQLQLDIDAVSDALVRLQQSGLINVSDAELRILDMAALEELASEPRRDRSNFSRAHPNRGLYESRDRSNNPR